MSALLRGLLAAALILIAVQSPAAAPIKLMLLDGESGGPWHKWQLTTPLLKKALEETGLFQVDVVTAPGTTGELTAFAPAFDGYKAIVLNYDAPDERWPASLKTAFERYVAAGGGVVVVHAADNAFSPYPAASRAGLRSRSCLRVSSRGRVITTVSAGRSLPWAARKARKPSR